MVSIRSCLHADLKDSFAEKLIYSKGVMVNLANVQNQHLIEFTNTPWTGVCKCYKRPEKHLGKVCTQSCIFDAVGQGRPLQEALIRTILFKNMLILRVEHQWLQFRIHVSFQFTL